jgi:hypothetical protein
MTIDDTYGATIAKQRLAILLTELRRAEGLTAEQVCGLLGWGRGKLGRFEMNRWKRPELSDIRDLLRLYRAERGVQDRITQLAMLARQRPWWREYGDIFPSEYPGFENDARQISVFLPLAIPDLLQTPAYLQTYAEGIYRPAQWRTRMVESTLGRQRILLRDGRTAPLITAVITEAALLYRWGSLAARREQITHLADLSTDQNIKIRIYPFEAGPHPGPLGPVCRLDFDPDDPSLLFLDTGLTMTLAEDPEQSAAHSAHLAKALDRCYSRQETTSYLHHLAKADLGSS